MSARQPRRPSFIAAVLVFIDKEEGERGKLKLELYTPVTRVEASDPTGA